MYLTLRYLRKLLQLLLLEISPNVQIGLFFFFFLLLRELKMVTSGLACCYNYFVLVLGNKSHFAHAKYNIYN